jgi:hypothetical protein
MNFDFGPMIDAIISRSTVGFVITDGNTPKPLGSGTLVRCAAIQGILTCGHVLEALRSHQSFGVVCFGVAESRCQKIIFDAADTVAHAISFFTPPGSATGPDLAFVPIPSGEMGALTALGSVVDLDSGEAKATSSGPAGAEAIEAVAGIVDEMTPLPHLSATAIILDVEGLVNVGRVSSTRNVNQFDLLEFIPNSSQDFALPSTYGGTSGGGIWRVYVNRQQDSTYLPSETRLTGVAFWETDPPDRKIIGHGPGSIYGHLLAEIRRRWSQ